MGEDPVAEQPAWETPGRIVGECIFCENTAAEFVVMPREDKALRVRCEGCGLVTEVERE